MYTYASLPVNMNGSAILIYYVHIYPYLNIWMNKKPILRNVSKIEARLQFKFVEKTPDDQRSIEYASVWSHSNSTGVT